MKITGVIWLDEIVEKLEYKHQVSIYSETSPFILRTGKNFTFVNML